MVHVIEQHTEELCALLTSEHGHPAASAKWEIEWLTKLYGPALHQMDLPDAESEMEQVGHVVKRYLPLGVVCAISLESACAAFVCESPSCVNNREYDCPQTFSIAAVVDCYLDALLCQLQRDPSAYASRASSN
jgi:hypothetical protein